MTRNAIFIRRTRRLLRARWSRFLEAAGLFVETGAWKYVLAGFLIWAILFLTVVAINREDPGIISPVPDGPVEVEEEKHDRRIDEVRDYLRAYSSPLADHAAEFVAAADDFGLVSSTLVAVAGVESTFATGFLCGSHNPFGYGNPCVDFGSYGEAIRRVARTIATSRYYRAYQESLDPRDLARVYNGGDREAWLRSFRYFVSEMAGLDQLTYVR